MALGSPHNKVMEGMLESLCPSVHVTYLFQKISFEVINLL